MKLLSIVLSEIIKLNKVGMSGQNLGFSEILNIQQLLLLSSFSKTFAIFRACSTHYCLLDVVKDRIQSSIIFTGDKPWHWENLYFYIYKTVNLENVFSRDFFLLKLYDTLLPLERARIYL